MLDLLRKRTPPEINRVVTVSRDRLDDTERAVVEHAKASLERMSEVVEAAG